MLFSLLCFYILLATAKAFSLESSSMQNGFNKDDKIFKFASYFQENMVLQRRPYRAVLWGYGTVGASVNVSLVEQVYSTKVIESPNERGIWMLTIDPNPAGGPYELHGVHDDHGLLSRILLKNIMFGDVWVCGGQSNMVFTVPMGFNASMEITVASNYPNIRLMTPAEVVSEIPLIDLKTIEQPWSVASNESVGGAKPWTYFSAVCWFFGRELYEMFKIPIGLISSNWGGTPIEAWSSPRALKKCGLDKRSDFRPNKANPQKNSVLWNAMIQPLLNMTIKGVVWYQGEANYAYHNMEYSCSFPAMIEDWRVSWYEGTGKQTHHQFPFGFVQLSTVNGDDDGSFPLIRWHQTADHGYVPNKVMPNTFMAVSLDLGDPASPYGSIHLRDKQDVGWRLMLGAAKVAYGAHVNPQGPLPESAVRTGDGHVVLAYPNEQRLVVSEDGNFMVCCSNSTCNYKEPPSSSNWLWAPILSYTHRTVTVSAQPCVAMGGQAEWIRYAWALTPCDFKKCSIYNDIRLPAPPFYMKVNNF